MAETCFLSPHSDDLVMNAFELIRRPYFPGTRSMLTLFGSSTYADEAKRPAYGLVDYTAVRLQEDGVFADWMGLEFNYFLLPDALWRNGRVPFSPGAPLCPRFLEMVMQGLAIYLLQSRAVRLVVGHPQGPVQHLDHRICWRAAVEVGQKLGLEVYVLDDIPYSVLDPIPSYLDQVAAFPLNQERWRLRHDRMEIYHSQMCPAFHEKVDRLLTANRGCERLFKLRNSQP